MLLLCRFVYLQTILFSILATKCGVEELIRDDWQSMVTKLDVNLPKGHMRTVNTSILFSSLIKYAISYVISIQYFLADTSSQVQFDVMRRVMLVLAQSTSLYFIRVWKHFRQIIPFHRIKILPSYMQLLCASEVPKEIDSTPLFS